MLLYLRTLQRAATTPEATYEYEAGVRRARALTAGTPTGERRARVTHTPESKLAHLVIAQAAFEVNPDLDLRACDKQLNLALGTLSQFVGWLSAGRLPKASPELIAFFEERKATHYTRAAKASKVARSRK